MVRIRLLALVVLSVLGLTSSLLMLLSYLPAGSVRAATTICVNGTPISDALADAQTGDTIRVAAGTYTEFVVITQTLFLLGGWNADCTQRDLVANLTVIRPPDATFSVVTIRGQITDTSIVAPTFDGFTVSGGGGGNHGGGLRVVDSNAIVSNNIITGNNGYLLGGGVWIQRGAPLLQDNRVEFNRVMGGLAYGGGLELENSQANLIGNVIANNAVSDSVGYGGGIAILDGGSVTLLNNIIRNNRAADEPGGATDLGFGGGVFVSLSDLIIRQGQILNNFVSMGCEGFGGGVHAYTSTITIDATRIEHNCAANTPATGQGAALAFLNSPFTVTSALIINNDSLDNDTVVGGIFADENSPGQVVNNTLADNEGQGIRTASTLLLTNNIILGHSTGVSLTASGAVTATYNNFFANTTNQRGFLLDATNLLVDPQLDADYHLESASPLLDAGIFTNLTKQDIDGDPRAMAGPSGLFKIDIGADERIGGLQKSYDLIHGAADFTIIGPGGQDPMVNGVNDWIGSAIMGSDIDGDERPDLIFSAHDWAEDPDNAPFTTGRAFALYNTGTRITGTIDLLTDTAQLTVVSRLKLQHIGSEFAGGDLNDDGFDDLIIGSSQDDGGGGGEVTPTVFALWGGPTLSGRRTLSTTTPADFALSPPGQDFFAFAAKNALTTADLNDDGTVDLIVGDALANDNGAAEAGAVFVIFGGDELSSLHKLSDTPADYTLYGPAANAGLGLVASGHMNDDGFVDLIARTETAAYLIYGPFSSGSLHLDTIPAGVTISGLQTGGVIVTDLTGDNQDDLILGADNKLYMLPGPFGSSENFSVTTRAALTLTQIPADALAAGHVVGNAQPDLIAGSRMLKQLYVVAGALTVSGTLPILEVAHTVVDVELATSLFADVGVGDFDFDQRPDLFISTAKDIDSHPDKYEDAGVVYVFYNTGAIVETDDPELALEKDVEGIPAPGGSVTYTLLLSNSGGDEPNALLVDALPEALDFEEWIEQPAGASVAGDVITWSGPLTAQEQISLRFVAKFMGEYGAEVTNTAAFTATAATGEAQATFAAQELLTVIRNGSGSGTVNSTTGGIICGVDCEQGYPPGDEVTLATTATISSNFAGWSGDCEGIGNCVVTMDAAKTVTATFTLKSFALSVTKAGDGSGSVVSVPAGINCGEDCDENYPYGSVVTLTATASDGSLLSGWGGACNGNGECIVTVDDAKEVIATFTVESVPEDLLHLPSVHRK